MMYFKCVCYFVCICVFCLHPKVHDKFEILLEDFSLSTLEGKVQCIEQNTREE